ncbi:hypothetical protein [Tenacibaculum jejuense]|uniref:Uncharacterized protein n=1 Tax=Tenacibaculum jejuense TaxID=584609 RepID=A0A238U5A1_9FLAO|nr:hypothetical protein [Tenacibaculum jejuense]SNR14383.1 Probable transmembrane protein of unknown function [Tenacibaculum jejuense]
MTLDFFIFTVMKEKLSHYWKYINFWVCFIGFKTIEHFYRDEIAFYYDQIPKPYITVALILLLIFITYKSFIPKKKDTDSVFIPSENDYTHKDTSLGFSIFLVTGLLGYAYIVNVYQINYMIVFTMIFVSFVSGIFLRKTASFQIKKGLITFKSGKEERTFNVSEITSLKVFQNQIILFKEDSQELISFLELEKEDFQNIKTYFNKRVPEISIALGQTSQKT